MFDRMLSYLRRFDLQKLVLDVNGRTFKFGGKGLKKKISLSGAYVGVC